MLVTGTATCCTSTLASSLRMSRRTAVRGMRHQLGQRAGLHCRQSAGHGPTQPGVGANAEHCRGL